MSPWVLASLENSIWTRHVAEMDIASSIVSFEACVKFIFFNLEHYKRFDPFRYIFQYKTGPNFYIDLSLNQINIFSREYRVYSSISNIPKQLEDIHLFLVSGIQILVITGIHAT